MKNISFIICDIAQNEQFFECYQFFFLNNLIESILSWLLIFSTIFANSFVIILIHRNSDKITIFDQILIYHALLDGLTGLIDIPIYHINSIFGYWPLSPIIATLWSIYDASINTAINLNMLYLSWSRLRSIQNPTSYVTEFIFKHSIYVMISIWLVSFLIWTPIVLTSGLNINSLILKINETSQMLLFKLSFWFLPFILIIIVSIIIFYYLKLRQNIRDQIRHEQHLQQNNNNNNDKSLFERVFKLKFGSHTLFTIMMSIYLVQWLLPFIVELLMFHSFIEESLDYSLYWLTYTVCLTDPLILIFFNANVSPFKTKHSSIVNQNRN